MRKIASWPLLAILSLLLSGTCSLHMARDAYRRPTSAIAAEAPDEAVAVAAATDDNNNHDDDDDLSMLVDPAVLLYDEMTAAAESDGNQFASLPSMRSTDYNRYLGQSYVLDERPLDLRRRPPSLSANDVVDYDEYRHESQRPATVPHHRHHYPQREDAPAGILRNSPSSSSSINPQRHSMVADTSTTTTNHNNNRPRQPDTPRSLQSLFTGSASSGGQPEPPPSHLDIRLEQSNQLKRAQNRMPVTIDVLSSSSSSASSAASDGALPPTHEHHHEQMLVAASKRASSSNGNNNGASYRSINGESVLQTIGGGGASGNMGDSGGGGGGGNGGSMKSSSSSFVGIPAQFSHGIASQLMLRTSRGQRNYDVPQIGKLINFVIVDHIFATPHRIQTILNMAIYNN